MLRKIVLSVVILLLLISGGSAQGETYQLPVRVHTLVACNQGALALTYTGEVFYVEEKSTAVQLTPMFADGELVYLEGICSGPNGMLYVVAYEEDGMAICQATLEGETLKLTPLGDVETNDIHFRLFDLMADQSGVMMLSSQEAYYWNAASGKTEQLATMNERLIASGGGTVVAYRIIDGNAELVQMDVMAQSASTIRSLPHFPNQIAVSPDGQVYAWCVDTLVTAWQAETDKLLQGHMTDMDTSITYPCCVTNDGRFYYANGSTVNCLLLTEDYTIGTDSLVIGQSGMEEAFTTSYRLTHPEVSVITKRLESEESDPAVIAQSIRMGDSSVDIYFIRTIYTGYRAMLEKGFCADLSGEAELVRQVQDMTNGFADAVTVDGKLRAVPYRVIFDSFSTLGCSQAAFDALGVSISELPSSTDELLDCILSWIEAGMLDDFWLHDLHQDRNLLYGLTLNGYIFHASQADGTVDLSDPAFTALMMKLDRVVQWIHTRSQPDDDAPALFSQKSLRYFLTSSADDDWKMLPVTPYPHMTPTFDVVLDVAIINPLSQHYQEAVDFLEYMLQNVEPEMAMLLWPSRAQPVENEGYTQEREFYLSEQLRLQTALETSEGSPQQRQALADALEDVQAALREMEPFRWRISESTISAYRAAVPSIVVQKDNTLNLVYDAGGLAAEERYAAQQISMEELLDTYAHLSESIAKEN